MRTRHYLLVCLLAIIGTIGSIAQQRPSRIPATPYPATYIQPDGDTLTLRLHGDEHIHYRTTIDGYKIVQDKKGYYRYARQNSKGYLTPGCRQAHDPEKRSKRDKRYLQQKGLK